MKIKNTVLQEILETKKKLLERRKRLLPLDQLRARCTDRKVLSLRDSLARRTFGIIAEVKKASPSAGVLRKRYSPDRLALGYERAGAAGISVLTCEPFFLGSLDHLARVRRSVGIPILRKDFITDEYQVVEALAYGADAVLLIAALLSPDELRRLAEACDRLGLETLVEVHDRADLAKTGVIRRWNNKILGINNRNLATLKTDLSRTGALLKCIRDDTIMAISESGVRDADDVLSLRRAGARGALVGESLLRAGSPAGRLRELVAIQ